VGWIPRDRVHQDGKVRLVSRNQNDLTPRYPELKDMPRLVQAKTAILDGEVVALDEDGKRLSV
jgi:bifunctional non-homologous end joining protein LigD